MARYTFDEINKMHYADMCKVRTLDELPEALENNIRSEWARGAGEYVNTGTEIRLVSADGRWVFGAKRHSNRRSGDSIWSVFCYHKCWGVKRDVIGFSFSVIDKYYGLTAHGLKIKDAPYKADVIKIIEDIPFAKEIWDKNKKK